jgi:error-prone DNA polymerase
MPVAEHVVADYQTIRLSLKAHPFEFLRSAYRQRGFLRTTELRGRAYGASVRTAGIVLIRQRPGSAKGVCFITLEDESGVANLVVWPDVMEQYRKVIMGARLIEVHGMLQLDEDVIHVVAKKLVDATPRLLALSDDLLDPAMATPDHVTRPLSAGVRGHPRNARVIPKSRDFH